MRHHIRPDHTTRLERVRDHKSLGRRSIILWTIFLANHLLIDGLVVAQRSEARERDVRRQRETRFGRSKEKPLQALELAQCISSLPYYTPRAGPSPRPSRLVQYRLVARYVLWYGRHLTDVYLYSGSRI